MSAGAAVAAPRLSQIALLVARGVRGTVRNPAAMLPNGVLSAFFLLVYNGLLGGSEAVRQLAGGNYVNFILPLAAMTAALAGANAGLALVQDMESGYLRRQLTMPISRLAIVVAPMLVAGALAAVQQVVVVALGLLLGADPAGGPAAFLAMIGLGVLWGIGFGGCAVAVALRTGNAEATFAASLLLFPVIYLSPAFLPEDQLQGWVGTASDLNPASYVLQGMRAPLVDGWGGPELWQGVLAGVLFALVTLTIASSVARRAVSTR